MLRTAALPFVLRRAHDVVGRGEVTTTRDELHGLLYLNGEALVVQWRLTREVSRVGKEIRTDRELGAVREVALPLSALAGASVRRVWQRWRFGEALVLTAADLQAFDALTGEGDVPGLVFEHPAEIVLEVRRTDRQQARAFASQLRLAVSEHLLARSEAELRALRAEEPGQEEPGREEPGREEPGRLLLEPGDAEESGGNRVRSERARA